MASGPEVLAPQPPKPARNFSFTDFQVNNPTAPPPGDRLDSEYDQTNTAVGGVIDWVGTSLNTDGTIRGGIIGENQLVPGLFDDISADAVAEVQPLVDQAISAAGSAQQSAVSAADSAGYASGSVILAENSASAAAASATASATSASDALSRANSAQSSASGADNSANHALGSANLAQDWADVSVAWAEHMPDNIPPNILAIMGITGDHWSSRWWANRAGQVVDEAGQAWLDQAAALLAQFEQLYLGAHPAPPSSDSQGNPLTIGAVYYDTVLGTMFVWTGSAWVPTSQPLPTQTDRYIYVATAGQMVFEGPDRDGKTLTYNPAANQELAVFRNGALRTPTDDFVGGENLVTMLWPCAAGDIVQVWIQTTLSQNYNWTTEALNTTPWVFDGVTTFFPLEDRDGETIFANGAVDVFLSLDGVWQRSGVDYTVTGTGLRFVNPPPAGSTAFGAAIVISPPTTTPASSGTTALDTSGWVFDGVAVTFGLLANGSPVTPPKAETVLISLDGVWQAAYTDYTVSGSTITFMQPPIPGTTAFGVSGLPSFGA